MERMRLLLFAVTLSLSVQASAESVALKNFREILSSYEAITGIAMKNEPLIQATYKKVVDQLPLRGTPDELSSPMIIALTQLGGAFCSKLIEKEAAVSPGLRRIFKRVDFATSPKQFNNKSRNSLFQTLADFFWQRDLKPEESEIFTEIFQKSVNKEMTAEATLNTMYVLCTAFGTSLEFVVR